MCNAQRNHQGENICISFKSMDCEAIQTVGTSRMKHWEVSLENNFIPIFGYKLYAAGA